MTSFAPGNFLAEAGPAGFVVESPANLSADIDLGTTRLTTSVRADAGDDRTDEPPTHRVFPLPPVPYVIGDEDDLWENANKLAQSVMREQTDSMNGSLDATLIFAGLFSAVNSALIGLSLPGLSADPLDNIQALLAQIVIGNQTLPNVSHFRPNSVALRDNVLFSVSLLFSLVVAFGAVLGKQWLVFYKSVTPGMNERKEALERQAKIKGASEWHLRLLLEMILPMLLQLSLGLFIIGLVDYLWSINHKVGIPIGSLALLATVAFLSTIGFAAAYPSCPFQSPFSTTVYHGLREMSLNLPVWFLITPQDKKRNRSNWKRWWRSIRTLRLEDFQSDGKGVPRAAEAQEITQTIVFTFEHTDDPSVSLPAVLSIPGLTDQITMGRIAPEVQPFLFEFFWDSISRLEREASTGFSFHAVKAASLFTRAILHFYVAGSAPENPPTVTWSDWWQKVDSRLGELNLTPTEMQYLTCPAPWKLASRRSIPPPPLVYLATILLRHLDSVSWPRSGFDSARHHAQTFVTASTAALSQRALWANVSMTIEGLQSVWKTGVDLATYDKLFAPCGETSRLKGLIMTDRTKRRVEAEKVKVWRIYRDSCVTQPNIEDDSLIEILFNAYSDELYTYLGPTNSIWGYLATGLVQSYRRDDPVLGWVHALSLLWHRLNIQRNHLEHKGQQEHEDMTDTRVQIERQLYVADSREEDHPTPSLSLTTAWGLLARVMGSRNRHTPQDRRRIEVFLAYVGMDDGSAQVHHRLLQAQPKVINMFGRISELQHDPLEEFALGVIIRHAHRWFEHEHTQIHDYFLDAQIPSLITRVVARTLSRFPHRGPTGVLQDVKPLLSILLRRGQWVQPLLWAFTVGAICDTLAPSQKAPGSGTWQIRKFAVRSELAKLVSQAGTSFMILECGDRHPPNSLGLNTSPTTTAPSHGSVESLSFGNLPICEGEPFPLETWYDPKCVSAIMRFIAHLSGSNPDERLRRVLHSYAKTLGKKQAQGKQLGNKGRIEDAEDIKLALAEWKEREQSRMLGVDLDVELPFSDGEESVASPRVSTRDIAADPKIEEGGLSALHDAGWTSIEKSSPIVQKKSLKGHSVMPRHQPYTDSGVPTTRRVRFGSRDDDDPLILSESTSTSHPMEVIRSDSGERTTISTSRAGSILRTGSSSAGIVSAPARS